MLSYLNQLGNLVYPFDQFNVKVSRLYETYPSHTWRQVGLARSLDLSPFVELFYNKYNYKVKIENHSQRVENLDASDAVVPCVTMAYALERYELESDWNRRQNWITDLEWDNRHQEGLIVKVD